MTPPSFPSVNYKCGLCGHEPPDDRGLICGGFTGLRCRDCYARVEMKQNGYWAPLDDPLGQKGVIGDNPR